jgi:hypothetical protein
MHRRDLIKAIPIAAVGQSIVAAETSHAREEQSTSVGARAKAPVTQMVTDLTLFVVGLWLLDFDGQLNAHVLAAINANGTKIPNSEETIHVHTPYVVVPSDIVDANATGGSDVTAAESQRWRWLGAGSFKKFPLSGEFEVANLRGGSDADVFGAFPLRRVNAMLEVKRPWYTDANTTTAYVKQAGGRLRDASPRHGVRVEWTFTDEQNKPTGDTPVRLTDTLEWNGRGPNVAIKIAAKAITKPNLPGITAFLVNLPESVSSHEEQNKRALHHLRALYKVFKSPPELAEQRIPRTTAVTYPSGEPVFCPPGTLL